MKRIITNIVMTACAAVLMSSCQKTPVEKKAGVPMTIQASVSAITVVSFDQGGITAVDTFTSTGEEGRSKAEFSGTWTGNAGDKVICLYPSVDSHAGNSIFDAVRVGSPTIYMRNLSTASGALQHDDPSSISDVDLMLGEVLISGDVAHVYLEHQFAVFRIEVTLRNFPYEAPDGSPFDQARINSIRIKCVDPDSDEEGLRPVLRPGCDHRKLHGDALHDRERTAGLLPARQRQQQRSHADGRGCGRKDLLRARPL